MPKIRIIGPDDGRVGPFAGYGTRLFIDGHELENVKRIELSPIEPGSVVTLKVECYVDAESEIELSADVATSIAPLDDGIIVEIAPQDGNKRYRLVRPGVAGS